MPATKKAFTSQPTLISTTPILVAGREAEELERTLYEKIRERAYLLFEQSDRKPGNEDENWLRAESEILGDGMEMRESGSWISLSAVLPEVDGQDMQIAVRPMRVVVRAPLRSNEHKGTETATRGEQAIFLATNLTTEVDPSSAATSFTDHALHLMIRKRRVLR